ncbi:MAG TPA: hypothetical protein VK843_12585 [Planctomycetota bacterium]|nr:hypothetical protein [Planctomycetota bacterium]
MIGVLGAAFLATYIVLQRSAAQVLPDSDVLPIARGKVDIPDDSETRLIIPDEMSRQTNLPSPSQGETPASPASQTESSSDVAAANNLARTTMFFEKTRTKWASQKDAATAMSLVQFSIAILMAERATPFIKDGPPLGNGPGQVWEPGADACMHLGGKRYWISYKEFPVYEQLVAHSQTGALAIPDSLALDITALSERVNTILVR